MPSADATVWVGGADSYRNGWIVVLHHPERNGVRLRTVSGADGLFELEEAPAILGVDMMIGCPDTAQPGGRTCDGQARNLLGHPRSASVFSPPAHAALRADSYEEALNRNRASGPNAPGLSKQAYNLFPKLRALADTITPKRQDRIREMHPELAFYAMNGDVPVDASKHSEEGLRTRIQLLAGQGFRDIESAVESWSGGVLGADDVLDAHAACWTAQRIHNGSAERCPPSGEPAPRNDRGLRMEIWR